MDPDLLRFGLSPGGLNDVLVVWHHGDHRHAVLTADYTESHAYISRLIKRHSASHLKQSFASQLTMLSEAGQALTMDAGGHELGLMRPLILGDRSMLGETPFLIAFERGPVTPEMPILAESRQVAVRLVRELDLAGWAEKAGWRAYRCERLQGTLARLLQEISNGRVTSFATELERQMYFVKHPQPKRQRRTAA